MVINISKLKPDDFVVFRERHDYGAFPPMYYAITWFTERMKKYYGHKLSCEASLTSGLYHAGHTRFMYGYRTDWDKLTKSIIRKIQQNPTFVVRTYRRSKIPERNLLNFSKKLLDTVN